jgi:hypothetical protein
MQARNHLMTTTHRRLTALMILFYGVPIVKMPLYHHALLLIAMVAEISMQS